MNTYNYLQEKSDKSFNYIRSYVYKNYIKTVIENSDNQNEKSRIMFIANRFKSNFDNPMSFECNGLIVEHDKTNNKYKFLVVPIPLFNSQKLIKSEIDYHYNANEYKLYKVYDGTIINLYYYNNEWKISTNKAYDANNLIFINNKTYKDILLEILTYYPEFSFNNLDKSKCYTLCMKYYLYHPFIENIHMNNNKLIFLQSVDMNEFNNNKKLVINETENIGLPISQQYSMNQFESLSHIFNSLNNEITRFKKEKMFSNYEPIFGIILRSTNYSNTKNYSNILIESNLMSKIRNLIYNHTFTKKLNFYNVLDKFNNMMIDKNYYNMINLISLKVFLTKKDMNLFMLLFPEYKPIMKMYDYMLKYMTKYLIKNYHIFDYNINNIDKILKNNLTLETNELPSDMPVNFNILNKLLLILYIDIKNKKLNLNVDEQYDIVYDYLNNVAFLDYFYSYFYQYS
jgi:hypothetical protein